MELTITDPIGVNDTLVFGEAYDAIDGKDTYDVPKPGIPPETYIYAWFDAGLTEPYNILWYDIREYPDETKTWDMYIERDDSTPDDITINWNPNMLEHCEYTSIILKHVDLNITTNMYVNNNYIYNQTPSTTHHFQIICKTTPYIIPLGDEWNIISAQCYENINKEDITVKNNSIEYTWDEAVSDGIILTYLYNFNRTTQNYQFTDTLKPGTGYWMWSFQDCELLIYSKETGTGHITDLKTEWNIMGTPYNNTIPKTSVNITNNTIDYTWQEAVNEGIILGFIYGWDSTNQMYELCEEFTPGGGYWMYSYYSPSLYITTSP